MTDAHVSFVETADAAVEPEAKDLTEEELLQILREYDTQTDQEQLNRVLDVIRDVVEHRTPRRSGRGVYTRTMLQKEDDEEEDDMPPLVADDKDDDDLPSLADDAPANTEPSMIEPTNTEPVKPTEPTKTEAVNPVVDIVVNSAEFCWVAQQKLKNVLDTYKSSQDEIGATISISRETRDYAGVVRNRASNLIIALDNWKSYRCLELKGRRDICEFLDAYTRSMRSEERAIVDEAVKAGEVSHVLAAYLDARDRRPENVDQRNKGVNVVLFFVSFLAFAIAVLFAPPPINVVGALAIAAFTSYTAL